MRTILYKKTAAAHIVYEQIPVFCPLGFIDGPDRVFDRAARRLKRGKIVAAQDARRIFVQPVQINLVVKVQRGITEKTRSRGARSTRYSGSAFSLRKTAHETYRRSFPNIARGWSRGRPLLSAYANFSGEIRLCVSKCATCAMACTPLSVRPDATKFIFSPVIFCSFALEHFLHGNAVWAGSASPRSPCRHTRGSCAPYSFLRPLKRRDCSVAHALHKAQFNFAIQNIDGYNIVFVFSLQAIAPHRPRGLCGKENPPQGLRLRPPRGPLPDSTAPGWYCFAAFPAI